MNERTGVSAIDRYLELNVAEGSQLYTDLMNKAQSEAANAPIKLLGEGDAGAASGGITQAMGSWYNSSVGTVRSAAIAKVEAMARDIKVGKKTPGKLVELEEDRLKRNQMSRRAEIHTNFSNENQSRIAELGVIQDEYDALRAEEYGRDAKSPPRWMDWLIPIAILVPETALNFESFLASPIIQTGAMALGIALIVGALIGVSSFMAGRFWKAYHYYMYPDDPKQKEKGVRRIGLAALLLFIALSSVAAARYYYLLPRVEEAEILGLTPPNLIWGTASLLIGNIGVFFLGAAVTYLLHDENPEYAEKYEKLERKKKELESIKRTALIGKLREIDRRYEQDRDRVRKIAKQIETHEGYTELRSALAAVEGKDLEVVGALQQYRETLVGALDTSLGNLFSVPDGLHQNAITDSNFTAQEFCGLPIKLYRC